MLQLKLESVEHKNVYRTVLVPENVSFFKLTIYVMAAFEIEILEEPIFESIIKNGNKEKREFLKIDANEEGEYPLDSQLLKDWFVKAGDEIIYTFADNISELKITLEKRILIPLKSNEPICLNGYGDLLTGKPIFIDMDSINDELKECHQFDAEEKQIEEFVEEEPDYKGLLQLSDEVKKLKPWEYFENSNVIVLDATRHVRFFVCIMGAGGQEYGIMIFDQNHYGSLYKILSGQPLPEDFHYDLEMMTVNFVNRDELTKEDYQLIKENGFSFRGKHNWIQFRVCNQGLVPAIPDSREVKILKLVLTMLKDVLDESKKGWKYPQTQLHEYPVFYYDNGELKNSLIRLKKIEEKKVYPFEISKQEKDKYKKKPKSQLRLEFDVKYLQSGVKLDEINRIAYPILAVFMDKATDQVISHRVLTIPKNPHNVQFILWDLLNELPNRPANIIVSKEVKQMVKGLEKELGLKITVGDLKHVRDLINSTEGML